MSKYVVKPGDNLTKIARVTGTTVSALVALNNIKDANRIYVGQVLTLPGVPTSPEPSETDYEKLGRAVEKAVEKVENLPEVQELMKLLE